ncbi:hypothetical protein VTO73DRAFT_11553 [Trametes versicolor]
MGIPSGAYPGVSSRAARKPVPYATTGSTPARVNDAPRAATTRRASTPRREHVPAVRARHRQSQTMAHRVLAAPHEPGCVVYDESGPCGGRRGAGAPRRAPARVHSPSELEAASASSCAFPSANTGDPAPRTDLANGDIGTRDASLRCRRVLVWTRALPSLRGAAVLLCTSPAAESRSSALDRASTIAFANTTTGLQVRGNRDAQPSNNAPTPEAIATSSVQGNASMQSDGGEDSSMAHEDDIQPYERHPGLRCTERRHLHPTYRPASFGVIRVHIGATPMDVSRTGQVS